MPGGGMIDGTTRAAAILLALDEETATQVLRHMSPHEVRELTDSNTVRPPPEALEDTWLEFEHLMADPMPIRFQAAGEHILSLAKKVFGRQELLEERKVRDPFESPVARLRSAKTSTLATLLEEEHPQVAAAVIGQLGADHAAIVTAALPTEFQVELIERLARTKAMPPRLVLEASQAIAAAVSAIEGPDAPSTDDEFDGIGFAAAILNALKEEQVKPLLHRLEEEFAELARSIRDKMFTFEDLVRLDTRNLQSVIKEIPQDRLLIALKTAEPELLERFFSVVSSRAAETMREDLALLPPMRVSDVEAAQQEIVQATLTLAENGQIQLPRGGESEMV